MIIIRTFFVFLFSLNALALDIENPFSIDDDVKEQKTDIKSESVEAQAPKESPGEPQEAKLEPAIPKLSGPVIDQTEVLNQSQQAKLAEKIRGIHQKDGPQIQILAVKSLKGLTIEEYSIRAAEKWRLGKKEKGNGVIIVMSQADRSVRIEVGEGIEGELTDLESHQIIQQKMIPQFKQGNFYQGFDSALNAIVAEFNIDPSTAGRDLSMPENIAKVRKGKEQIQSILLPVLIFFVTFPLLFKLLGRNSLLRSVAGSAYLGALTYFFVGQMFFIILAVIFGFIVGLIGPLNFLMAALSHRGRGSYYGRGRGGFGGGGWSGGGGGFSGGGASGRW